MNKVQENEQRFSFALFSADMSAAVAMACGLWFADTGVKKEEKYLYRVVINSADSLRGSIFIGPDDPYTLAKPHNLIGKFQNGIVSLKWDKSPAGHYTAYVLERSDDGKVFHSITESPVVTVSPSDTADTRYEYAIDSLQHLFKIYHYRIRGITPFGEEGPPSNVVSGRGTPPVDQVPYISMVKNINNSSLLIRWDFPEMINDAISGFLIERSSKPKGGFSSVTENTLSSGERKFEDRHPKQVNYYRVTAVGLDGEFYPSHVYFAQLVDSLAPAFPHRLKAEVNEEGRITLSWQPNAEPDIYGYRVYKSNHKSEELVQITSKPILQASFTDQVDLHTLNETVFYSVMAVDVNQNHSPLSELLKVDLPDKIRPQPPVILPARSGPPGISLKWTPGGSEDIVRYSVYRKSGDQPQWAHIASIEASADSIYHYLDKSALPGLQTYYTVIAIDDAGLESDPAPPVSTTRVDNDLAPSIQWKKPEINREQNQITLAWTYAQPAIRFFRIYRAADHHRPVLFKTIDGEQRTFTDTMIPGKHYSYRIMALHEGGKKSFLSEVLEFQY